MMTEEKIRAEIKKIRQIADLPIERFSGYNAKRIDTARMVSHALMWVLDEADVSPRVLMNAVDATVFTPDGNERQHKFVPYEN